MYKRFCDICGKEITSDSDCAVLCTNKQELHYLLTDIEEGKMRLMIYRK